MAGPQERGSDQFSFADKVGRQWTVKLRWQEVGGRIECTSFAVEADPERLAPITTTLLREMKVPTLIAERRQRRLPAVRHMTEEPGELGRRAGAQVAAYEAGVSERPTSDPDFYKHVAVIYKAAWRRGDNPTKAVATALHGSRSTAGTWVDRARQRGELEEAEGRGRAGEVARSARSGSKPKRATRDKKARR